MKTYGEWMYSTTSAVGFTPLRFYSRRNSPRYSLYRRLGGPQLWKREKSLAHTGNTTPMPGSNIIVTPTAGPLREKNYSELNFIVFIKQRGCKE
jgi:hypothetical protein